VAIAIDGAEPDELDDSWLGAAFALASASVFAFSARIL